MRTFRARELTLDNGREALIDAEDMNEGYLFVSVGRACFELSLKDAIAIRDAMSAWIDFEEDAVPCPGCGWHHPNDPSVGCRLCESGLVTRSVAREMETNDYKGEWDA